MTESFLHYVWQYQYFDKRDLLSTDGDPVTIYHPGVLNTDSGPDFFNARIRIGSMQWVGNVEIHIHSSAWNDHQHQDDEAYDNVILHVVWKEDKNIKRKDGTVMPTLVIGQRVSEQLILSYRKLVSNTDTIACASSWNEVNPLWKSRMIEHSLLRRLQTKAGKVLDLFKKRGNDWEETCYQLIGENFGFKVNAAPFRQLVQKIPHKILQKHADKLYQLEALLLGQAGFLEEFFQDDYFLLLKREYQVLRRKYRLEGTRLSPSQWKFLRLRPANFPTLRLAQFAALIHSRKSVFSGIVSSVTTDDLRKIFSVSQSDYWRRHYRFGEEKDENVNPPGEESIVNLIINSAVPLWVAYGTMRGEPKWTERAVSGLHDLQSEKNSITRRYTSLGLTLKSAYDSQGAIELYNHFCQKKRCLDCTIGNGILKPMVSR